MILLLVLVFSFCFFLLIMLLPLKGTELPLESLLIDLEGQTLYPESPPREGQASRFNMAKALRQFGERIFQIIMH